MRFIFPQTWRSRLAGHFRTQLQGQSSVEYAIVFAAFLALLIGLGAMANLFQEGTVVNHALQSASHHLKDVASGAWAEVLLY